MAKNDTQRLSDEEIRILCEQELTATSEDSDISEERAKALDRYNGALLGNEKADRSQVRTRETLDTVEWVLASMMRTFSDAENIATFEPTGPEDVEAAKQETAAVRHILWKETPGFLNLYTFIKDGLLQKTGVLKCWWDDSEIEER